MDNQNLENDTKIFNLLNDLKLTIEEFATDTNIHPERVKAALAKKVNLTRDECERIIEIYELESNYFSQSGYEYSNSSELSKEGKTHNEWGMSAGRYLEMECDQQYKAILNKTQAELSAAQRIQLLRNSLNMSLQDFAKPLGVTKATISHIELGRRQLTEQMENSICNAYKVNREWLETGVGEIQKELFHAEKATLLRTIEEMDEVSHRKLFSFLIQCINDNIQEEDFGRPITIIEKVCNILESNDKK